MLFNSLKPKCAHKIETFVSYHSLFLWLDNWMKLLNKLRERRNTTISHQPIDEINQAFIEIGLGSIFVPDILRIQAELENYERVATSSSSIVQS